MKRFDPPQDLTLSEITQIFREMFGDISEEQAVWLAQMVPTVSAYVVETDPPP